MMLLTAILIWNFDDTVVSMLPDGEVPFNKNEVPVGTDHTSLRKEWKNLYHFVKGGNDGLSKTRRESMFIQMLEGLHPEESRDYLSGQGQEPWDKVQSDQGTGIFCIP